MVGSKAMMKKEFTDWLAQAAVQVAKKMISFYLLSVIFTLITHLSR